MGRQGVVHVLDGLVVLANLDDWVVTNHRSTIGASAQVVLDLVVDHEMSHLDPATEELLLLAIPSGHDFDAKPALNELCADGLLCKARHAGSDTYRLTKTGLAHGRRLDELTGLAGRLLPQLSTFPTGTEATITWAILVDKGAASAPDFFACMLLIRVLALGELTTVSVHTREAHWRITSALPTGSTLPQLLTHSAAAPHALTPKSSHAEAATSWDEHRLPHHEPSARYKLLQTWPGYVSLSEEFQGANGWLKLVLALLTLVPHLAPIKVKSLALELSLASLVYVVYHCSNLALFLKVKQAASHTAALTSKKEQFDKLATYNSAFVHKLEYAVYALIALTIILKIWGQAGTLPGSLQTIARWIGVPI